MGNHGNTQTVQNPTSIKIWKYENISITPIRSQKTSNMLKLINCSIHTNTLLWSWMYFINHNDVVEIYQWTQCFIIIQSPINSTYKTPFVLNKRAISIQCTTPIIWLVANRDRFVITL